MEHTGRSIEMSNLTKKQLYEASLKHQYLLLRFSYDNTVIGVNCKVAELKMFDDIKNQTSQTQFISYTPCDFMEYISKKVPFISFEK